jgi:hypothetical protein
MLVREYSTEQIFSYAVALDQSGRNKNMVFAYGKVVYILNNDKTILLRFSTKRDKFETPVSFFASDYDSPNFKMEGDQIVFIQSKGGFERNKQVNVPESTFVEIDKKFSDLWASFDKEKCQVSIRKEMLELLDESLSHIEFVGKNKELLIVQRDIFSGAIITLRKQTETGLGLSMIEEISQDFTPIGMRTNDFFALFSFNDEIKLKFFSDYFLVKGNSNEMEGIVALCIYDNLGYIKQLKEDNNGR